MWICPKCKHKFLRTNQAHECSNYTIENFLEDKSDKAINLFFTFISAFNKTSTLDIHPYKTRIDLSFKTKFCSIIKIGIDFIDGYLVFDEVHTNNSCFYKIEMLSDNNYQHYFRLYNKADINDELVVHMKLAYDLTKRKQTEKKSPAKTSKKTFSPSLQRRKQNPKMFYYL